MERKLNLFSNNFHLIKDCYSELFEGTGEFSNDDFLLSHGKVLHVTCPCQELKLHESFKLAVTVFSSDFFLLPWKWFLSGAYCTPVSDPFVY